MIISYEAAVFLGLHVSKGEHRAVALDGNGEKIFGQAVATTKANWGS